MLSLIDALSDGGITPGMCPISVLLNLLWIIFGGLWMAVGWMIAASSRARAETADD